MKPGQFEGPLGTSEATLPRPPLGLLWRPNHCTFLAFRPLRAGVLVRGWDTVPRAKPCPSLASPRFARREPQMRLLQRYHHPSIPARNLIFLQS